MSKDQGSYAFPIPEKSAAADVQHGMTIRDYFAAKAMQALLHNNASLDASLILPAVRVAAIAYDIANAMTEERDK